MSDITATDKEKDTSLKGREEEVVVNNNSKKAETIPTKDFADLEPSIAEKLFKEGLADNSNTTP